MWRCDDDESSQQSYDRLMADERTSWNCRLSANSTRIAAGNAFCPGLLDSSSSIKLSIESLWERLFTTTRIVDVEKVLNLGFRVLESNWVAMESFRRRRRSEGKGVSEIARVRLHEAFSQNVDAVITPPDCCCAFLYTLWASFADSRGNPP